MLKGELMLWISLYREMTAKAFWEEAHNHLTLLLDDCHVILGKSA